MVLWIYSAFVVFSCLVKAVVVEPLALEPSISAAHLLGNYTSIIVVDVSVEAGVVAFHSSKYEGRSTVRRAHRDGQAPD